MLRIILFSVLFIVLAVQAKYDDDREEYDDDQDKYDGRDTVCREITCYYNRRRTYKLRPGCYIPSQITQISTSHLKNCFSGNEVSASEGCKSVVCSLPDAAINYDIKALAERDDLKNRIRMHRNGGIHSRLQDENELAHPNRVCWLMECYYGQCWPSPEYKNYTITFVNYFRRRKRDKCIFEWTTEYISARRPCGGLFEVCAEGIVKATSSIALPEVSTTTQGISKQTQTTPALTTSTQTTVSRPHGRQTTLSTTQGNTEQTETTPALLPSIQTTISRPHQRLTTLSTGQALHLSTQTTPQQSPTTDAKMTTLTPTAPQHYTSDAEKLLTSTPTAHNPSSRTRNAHKIATLTPTEPPQSTRDTHDIGGGTTATVPQNSTDRKNTMSIGAKYSGGEDKIFTDTILIVIIAVVAILVIATFGIVGVAIYRGKRGKGIISGRKLIEL